MKRKAEIKKVLTTLEPLDTSKPNHLYDLGWRAGYKFGLNWVLK